MHQLLKDPQTLPFKKGKKISLAILKKEIRRRIVKIKSMLGENQPPIRKDQYAQCACQTQNMQPNYQIQAQPKQHEVLSPRKSTVNLPVESNQKMVKYAGRCSLPVRKLNDKKIDENGLRKSNRVRVSQYLLTAKAKDDSVLRKNEDKVSASKNMHQLAQKSKIFSNNQYDFFNSFKNSKKKSQLYIQKGGNLVNVPLAFQNLQENFGLLQFDSEDSDLHYVKSASAMRKGMSVKKIKFTERTALEQQKRLFVSQQTIKKMSNQVSKLAAKKRREAQDNKLRQNIFKKIEEKYGQYFDNI